MPPTSAFGLLSASRLVLILLLVWLLALMLFFMIPFYTRSETEMIISNDSNGKNDLIVARLNRASLELNSLRAQNTQLRELIDTIRSPDASSQIKNPPVNDARNHDQSSNRDSFSSTASPTVDSNVWSDMNQLQYLQQLTTLQSHLIELKRFLVDQFPKNNSFSNQLLKEHFYDLQHTIGQLEQRDQQWKRDRISRVRAQVWDAIDRNQNPSDCGSARKLVCQLNKGCGFGCQMHHVAFCLISALATGRTLILNTRNWRYTPQSQLTSDHANGWQLVFEPLSRTCLDATGAPRSLWKPNLDDFQVLDMPIIDAIHPSPPFVPLTIPRQIHQELIHLHSMPHAWFVGQIIGYILRPSTLIHSYVLQSKKRFGFRRPIVGLQVRRTDKLGTEASYHKLSEYMDRVAEYYDRVDFEQMKSGKKRVERRVYLATDEFSLWTTEVPVWQKKGYVFVGDSEIAKTAGLRNRYSILSLKNIILDIFLLSECDHLVCTFSSQVCRLAFELMQTRGMNISDTGLVDYSNAYESLDDIYYFGGQRPHNHRAMLRHVAGSESEINMEIGDEIGIAGNHWNGFSKGVNKRTKQSGLFPSFKVKDLIETIV